MNLSCLFGHSFTNPTVEYYVEECENYSTMFNFHKVIETKCRCCDTKIQRTVFKETETCYDRIVRKLGKEESIMIYKERNIIPKFKKVLKIEICYVWGAQCLN